MCSFKHHLRMHSVDKVTDVKQPKRHHPTENTGFRFSVKLLYVLPPHRKIQCKIIQQSGINKLLQVTYAAFLHLHSQDVYIITWTHSYFKRNPLNHCLHFLPDTIYLLVEKCLSPYKGGSQGAAHHRTPLKQSQESTAVGCKWLYSIHSKIFLTEKIPPYFPLLVSWQNSNHSFCFTQEGVFNLMINSFDG